MWIMMKGLSIYNYKTLICVFFFKSTCKLRNISNMPSSSMENIQNSIFIFILLGWLKRTTFTIDEFKECVTNSCYLDLQLIENSSYIYWILASKMFLAAPTTHQILYYVIPKKYHAYQSMAYTSRPTNDINVVFHGNVDLLNLPVLLAVIS